MDARIAQGEREARAWMREKWWLLGLTGLMLVGGPVATWFIYAQRVEPIDGFMIVFSLFPALIAGLVVVERTSRMRMEARRDAALMELEHANAVLGSRDGVRVDWVDRIRYAPGFFWFSVLLSALAVAMYVVNTLSGDWFELINVVLWTLVGLNSARAFLKQEDQEQLTQARVKYREAVEAGADLRGAFSLAVTHSGDLEMKDERSALAGEEVVLDLDEDVFRCDMESGVDVKR